MNALKNGNLALRFCLELASLASVSIWGFVTPGAIWLKVLLGTASPAAAGLAWGLFVSPKARIPVHWSIKGAAEAAVFTGAAVSLFAVHRTALAFVFVVLAVVSRSIKTVLDLRSTPD